MNPKKRIQINCAVNKGNSSKGIDWNHALLGSKLSLFLLKKHDSGWLSVMSANSVSKNVKKYAIAQKKSFDHNNSFFISR